MTISTLVASVAGGLFAGACVYVTVVEHPAWVESGPALAIKHFGPGQLHAVRTVAGVVAFVVFVAMLLRS